MSEQEGRSRSTGIEWTEHTWNPMVGCSLASAGCTNCYAMRQAARIERMGHAPHYDGMTKVVNGRPVWTGKVAQASHSARTKPLRHREPAVFFVNSMSDMFHPDMEWSWIDDALDVMQMAPQHTYQVLTKRPEFALEYFRARRMSSIPDRLWLGVSVEDAKVVDRIDTLRQIPVPIRFLSVEPLIGAVGRLDLSGIHWVITGGESGAGARPSRPEWTREVRDACRAQGVAYFHKQWGIWANNPLVVEQGMSVAEAKAADLDAKAKGGATLDGRLHRDLPQQ